MNKFLVGFLIIIAILIVLWAVYTASDTKEEFVEGEQTRREDIETLALYFGNSRKMDLPIDCGWVYPVEREVKEKSERSSLEELLGGPSGEEEKNGYFSAIKKGVQLEEFLIDGKTAKIRLSSDPMPDLGGLCSKAMIKSQIEQTLKQFPGIEDIEITVIN
ncbi:MAG: hypothetical protein A2365_03070 [Candidatus Nealsonbacteria bacterium RIFOXYB1_FULL_40_15]|uniref:GerMN domain-containing protein n=2 Tax=Candidatus Nealsoniibacteriota TaxID=1817911 RepID=A0A1G2ETR3_9BACT|nr:MAG: hypothetical protein A2365_03070 [Candidatus Nealsonbacteria bacterium RIFOXYB1_FULL_40_15]OGZ29209.1 MAG: hypothetical protein A2427_02925 [Candidatus Nealsonbacteria bacterium RIFOXYC1_FULL_40_7]OGZ29891.1 MAG: hypothetical protein A2562_02105 [Candidatus Nealsonbacteria bacterium RIFOXYD1_FULL_39_11]